MYTYIIHVRSLTSVIKLIPHDHVILYNTLLYMYVDVHVYMYIHVLYIIIIIHV